MSGWYGWGNGKSILWPGTLCGPAMSSVFVFAMWVRASECKVKKILRTCWSFCFVLGLIRGCTKTHFGLQFKIISSHQPPSLLIVSAGGFKGCGHGHKGHPGRPHWSCCGNTAEKSECLPQSVLAAVSPRRHLRTVELWGDRQNQKHWNDVVASFVLNTLKRRRKHTTSKTLFRHQLSLYQNLVFYIYIYVYFLQLLFKTVTVDLC